MTIRSVRVLRRVATLMLVASVPLAAQPAAKAKAKAKAPAPDVVGMWSGTATVPLPDSAIVVPVFYTFTQSGSTIGGNAMVPGQGTGPISNVVRDGARVQFRVTAPENRLLEHDGKFTAPGTIEGMVQLDNQPVATFKIVMKPQKAPAK